MRRLVPVMDRGATFLAECAQEGTYATLVAERRGRIRSNCDRSPAQPIDNPHWLVQNLRSLPHGLPDRQCAKTRGLDLASEIEDVVGSPIEFQFVR